MTTALTLYVLRVDGMTLIAVAERDLSGSILLCWFVAAKPSTYCVHIDCILFSYLLFTIVVNKRHTYRPVDKGLGIQHLYSASSRIPQLQRRWS